MKTMNQFYYNPSGITLKIFAKKIDARIKIKAITRPTNVLLDSMLPLVFITITYAALVN